jgi:threonine/homoserine/homoserine lactone efflux protein
MEPTSEFAAPLAVFGQALLIGLGIAAPVGPIGLLVIQRTLQQGRVLGLATGLGAAVADALYGAVGAFGVQGLIQTLQSLRLPLALGGGLFLLWLGWRTWAAAGAVGTAAAAPGAGQAQRLLPAFAGTLLLTLSNPATILSFVAIFGALAGRGASASPLWMVAGVLTGSALWWLLLCAGVGALRERFDVLARRRVGRASALLLGGFGLWALAGVLRP